MRETVQIESLVEELPQSPHTYAQDSSDSGSCCIAPSDSVKMSIKRKRGIAKCMKKFDDPNKFTIEFNKKGLAIGKNAAIFKSWVGIEFRKRIPYHKIAKHIDKQQYDELWEYIKESWKILNNDAKDTVMQLGKVSMRNFRHILATEYAQKDISPFEKYKFLDSSHWETFVLKVKSEGFKKTSQKAKMSAAKNIEHARVGRMGFVGLEDLWEDRWAQLVKSYPHLEVFGDERIQKYTVSRAYYNHVTKSYELPPRLLSGGKLKGTLHNLHCKEREMKEDGTYYEVGKDVVTEVVGKGRHHGGRTLLVSSVLGVTKTLHSGKRKKKSDVVEKVREERDAMQRDQYHFVEAVEASSVIRLPEIESISTCDLLWPFDDSFPNMILGHGQVYPTSDRILDDSTMHVDYVKIYVDGVTERYKRYPVPPHTMKPEEVTDMGSTQGQFIQWPRKAIRLLNTHSQQVSAARHQQLPDYSECYTPALLDEGRMEFQEVNARSSFVDMLNVEIPMQPTHTEDVPDLEVIETVSTLPVRSDPVPTPYALTESIPTPYVLTEPVSTPPVSTKPVRTTPDSKPNIKNTKIATLLSKVKKRRHESIYRLVEQLALKSNESATIAVTSPDGMYKEPEVEHFEIEELIKLSIDEWAELGTMNWYMMYLYAMGEVNNLNKTAYFNPHYIALNTIEANENLAINHIKCVMEYHKKKQYFMAPYLAWGHWSLIMIHRNPRDKIYYGHIIDSSKEEKNASRYKITELFEKVTKTKITWKMEDCHQQSGTWECGYYVMKAMHDFVITCKEHLMMHNCRPLSRNEIDKFVESILKTFVHLHVRREQIPPEDSPGLLRNDFATPRECLASKNQLG